MSTILTIIGIIMSINGLFLLIFSNLNIGVIMTAALGIFFLVWGVFYNKINDTFPIFKISVIILSCAEVLLVGFIAVYGVNDNVNYDEDALIVLGAGLHGDKVTLPLKLRLDKAIEYYNKNPESLIVVTGGQGFQETVTEASAMEKYLMEHGVENILKEEKATSTNENMRFSKQMLDTYFNKDYKAAFVTNTFHIYRGAYIAKSEGFKNISHIHAGLQWYNQVPCYLRESLAILKMWILG